MMLVYIFFISYVEDKFTQTSFHQQTYYPSVCGHSDNDGMQTVSKYFLVPKGVFQLQELHALQCRDWGLNLVLGL